MVPCRAVQLNAIDRLVIFSTNTQCTINYKLMFDFGRLLYFMLVKYRECGQCLPADGMSLDFMIYNLCAMIWHERNLIIEMNTPNATKDLFLEQSKCLAFVGSKKYYDCGVDTYRHTLRNLHFIFSALLCGFSGYVGFLDENIVIETVKSKKFEFNIINYDY